MHLRTYIPYSTETNHWVCPQTGCTYCHILCDCFNTKHRVWTDCVHLKYPLHPSNPFIPSFLEINFAFLYVVKQQSVPPMINIKYLVWDISVPVSAALIGG